MLNSRAVGAIHLRHDPHSLSAFEALRALHRDDDEATRVQADYEPFRQVWLDPQLEGAFVKGVDIALHLHDVHALDGSKLNARPPVQFAEVERVLCVRSGAGGEACSQAQDGEEFFHVALLASTQLDAGRGAFVSALRQIKAGAFQARRNVRQRTD